jgi:large subunit ribosomal protein L13e
MNHALPNVHLAKDWQERVKTWFNQPARKKRRRDNREKKRSTLTPK